MEVLADVYFCVIQQLIQRSKENNNSDDDIAYIYRAIPDYYIKALQNTCNYFSKTWYSLPLVTDSWKIWKTASSGPTQQG
jgi:hypothetical protein